MAMAHALSSMIELLHLLERHELWVKSGGLDGSGANLSGINLSLSEFKFIELGQKEVIGFQFNGLRLDSIDLSFSNLREKEFKGCHLCFAKFNHSLLSYSKFNGAKLDYANFSHCTLSSSDFRGSSLKGTNLSGIILEPFPYWFTTEPSLLQSIPNPLQMNVNFSGAILTNADLSGANLRFSVFRGATLHGACLNGTNLAGADLRWTDLVPEQIENTIIDYSTKLPWHNTL